MSVVNENGAKSKDKRLNDVNAILYQFHVIRDMSHTFHFCSRRRTQTARGFIDFNWVTNEQSNGDVLCVA